MTFFTSDIHFGHSNIIKSCLPLSSVICGCKTNPFGPAMLSRAILAKLAACALFSTASCARAEIVSQSCVIARSIGRCEALHVLENRPLSAAAKYPRAETGAPRCGMRNFCPRERAFPESFPRFNTDFSVWKKFIFF